MVKWTEENKLQMLLAIIEHLNPTSLPWEKISSAMGDDFSLEAVRQQYKTIKKGFKTTTTSSSSGTVSTSPKPTKAKPTTTKAKKAKAAPTTNGAPKGRKRKAAEISINEDDDEDNSMADGSSGIKTESSAAGLTAQVFKAEPVGDGGVDLENDALYSSD